jgi:hypothetical protein
VLAATLDEDEGDRLGEHVGVWWSGLGRGRGGHDGAVMGALSRCSARMPAPERAFGFKSPEAMIALAMLNLGGYCPPLPGRNAA